MKLNSLSPKQVTELRNELATVPKKNLRALQSTIYLDINDEEIDEYDQSRVRISELYELLTKSVDNDVRNWS